ncbi:hypothetical protein UFOVP273_144 [uncultured Caudovirales phage]|uniref:Uncharacterized protein n=1 Tax=uncultured Caudovirales phage TaxID=2100421 RepID=A0A6J5LK09_9CAUD|nr:hypothetical protein UFOVP273_144 [uncultured Caudovirales phage]
MANNTTDFTLRLKTEGLDQATASSKELNKNLTQAAAAASKIGSSSRGGSATLNTIKNQSQNSNGYQESVDYGVTRSARGTGAAARDFAQQAQGLGGLVHLYATFAANVFAVSTAFDALSKAMDTANLVQGLEQLGAASGKSLTSVARGLVVATDGAISLRDAMEATAKASAAGLASSQIEKLGEVARKASLALGRDMSDSFTRLSTGISKMQPELIDELGLYTKINPAVEKYAASVGRSVTSLSDFERRQAFANAVLQEGLDKFKDINVDSSPYAKLSASITNLTQTGLTLVNTVLTPVVDLLSKSPTALTGVMVYLGSVLLKQAIPVITQFQKISADAAEKSKALAQAQAAEALKAQSAYSDYLMGKALEEANREVAIAKDRAAQLAAIRAQEAKDAAAAIDVTANEALKTKKGSLYNITQQVKADPSSVTPDQLGGIKSKFDAEIAKRVSQGNIDGANKLKAAYAALATSVQAHVAAVDAEVQADLKLSAVQDAIIAKYAAEEENLSLLNFARQKEIVAKKAQQAANAATIKQAALEEFNTLGLSAAYESLSLSIKKALAAKEITIGQAAITGISTVAQMAASRVALIASAFSGVGLAVALLFGAFEVLNGWLSTNSKETEEFSKNVEATNSTLDNTQKIIKAMGDNSSNMFANLTAQANNAQEALTNLNSLISSLSAADAAASWWDRLIDGDILSIFNKDLKSKFAVGVAASITSGIQDMPEGDAKQAFQNKLSTILGTTDLSTEGLKSAIKDLEPEKVIAVAKQIASAQTAATAEIQKSVAAMQGFKDALDKVQKANTDFTNSLLPTDSLAKLGESLIEAGLKYENLMDKPTQALANFNELLKNTSNLAILSPAAVQQILAAKDDIASLTKDLERYDSERKSAQADISTLVAGHTPESSPRLSNDRAKLETANKGYTDTLLKVVDLMHQIQKPQEEMLENGKKFLDHSVTVAKEMAGITAQRASVAGVSGVGAARIELELKNQELDIQQQNIDQMQELNKNLTLNTLEISKSNQLDAIKAAQSEPAAKRDVIVAQANKVLAGINEAMSYIRGETKNQPTSLEGRQALSDYNTKSTGYQQQTAGIQGQRVAADASYQLSALKEQNDIKQRGLQIDAQRAQISSQVYGIISSSNSAYSEGLLTLKKQADSAQLAADAAITEAQYKAKISEIEKNITEAQKNGADATTLAALAQNKADLTKQLEQNKSLLDYKKQLASVQADIDLIKLREAANQQNIADQQTLLGYANEISSAQNEYARQQLDQLKNIGAIGEANYAQQAGNLEALNQEQQTNLALTQAKLDAEKQISQIHANAAIANAAASLLPTTDAQGGNPQADAKAQIAADEAKATGRVNALLDAQINKINAVNASKLAGIKLLTQESVRQAKLNSLTEDLRSIFGDLGSAMGNVVKTFSDITEANKAALEQETKLTKAKQDAIDLAEKDPTVKNKEAAAQATQDLATFEDQQTSQTLANDAKLAGSVANLFGKKTKAYKAFAAVEKALHLMRLAMDIKEMVSDATKTVSAVTNSGTRSAAYGVESILNTLKSIPFPYNIAAAAVVAAMVAALLGGKGKSVSIQGGFKAEDAQRVQGTGQKYDANGNVVETGGGVLGDPTAKMESVKKALDILNSNTVEGLSYSNEMVKLLTSIDTGINKAAAGLVNIPGLRTGSAFGTVEGTWSHNTVDRNDLAGVLFNSSAVSGLFGHKTTENVQVADSGLKVAGTLLQLAQGLGKMQQYENDIITSKSSSLWGLVSHTSTSTQTLTQDLNSTDSGKQVEDFFTSVFSDSLKLLENLGAAFGKTKDSVDGILAALPVDAAASLKGLTGQDFTDALSGMINTVLDQSTRAIFGNIVTQYQKMGETALETVVRVVDDNDKVNLAMQSMGKTTLDASFTLQDAVGTSLETIKNQSIAASEAMVENAGGIDKFVQQAADFNKNFLTDQERLAPIQASVEQQLAALGYSGVTSREQFKNIVEGLDLTTASGQKTYQSLMDIANSFAMVYPQLQKSMSAEEFRTAQLKDEIDIQKALGNQYAALQLSRNEELYQLSLYPPEQAKVMIANKKILWALQDQTAVYNQQVEILKEEGKTAQSVALQRQLELLAMDDRLRPGQEYIWALQDENDIITKLTDARQQEADALNTTMSSLDGYINTLKGYKESLSLGSNSILTNQQKYQAAKDNFDSLLAIANGPATTDAQKQAQADAVQQLTSAADSFLQLSQEMYASSDQYATDYNSVMQAIDSTTGNFEDQKSAAQQQLDYLNASTSFLDSISQSSQTTAELLTEYYAQQEVVNNALLALPAALDTTDIAGALQSLADSIGVTTGTYTPWQPGQDSSGDSGIGNNSTTATADSLSAQIATMTQQIASLQAEIAQLRADQQQQTDDIVGATLTSGNNVSNTITETSTNSSQSADWNIRSRPVMN